ncbi:hypothetical protein E2C01_101242 [Portunus trituberculatus]|uniref:Uncharacterized protein n=1 Tax=Portunus trituberculatus TaxID=210409 RepID=A0A5B7KLG7_PORTR|nr:hypothetical protein [Portunus trituberculatus]
MTTRSEYTEKQDQGRLKCYQARRNITFILSLSLSIPFCLSKSHAADSLTKAYDVTKAALHKFAFACTL